MRTTIKVETSYTMEEIEDVLLRIERGEPLTYEDIQPLIYASKQWIDLERKCKSDPSYQWGYGYTHY